MVVWGWWREPRGERERGKEESTFLLSSFFSSLVSFFFFRGLIFPFSFPADFHSYLTLALLCRA